MLNIQFNDNCTPQPWLNGRLTAACPTWEWLFCNSAKRGKFLFILVSLLKLEFWRVSPKGFAKKRLWNIQGIWLSTEINGKLIVYSLSLSSNVTMTKMCTCCVNKLGLIKCVLLLMSNTRLYTGCWKKNCKAEKDKGKVYFPVETTLDATKVWIVHKIGRWQMWMNIDRTILDHCQSWAYFVNMDTQPNAPGKSDKVTKRKNLIQQSL